MGADTGPLNELRLAHLVAGHWSRWRGLTAAVTLDDVEAQLGPSLDTAPHSGMFGGSPTAFRRWERTPQAPQGLKIWFEGRLAVGVELHHARRDPADPELPEPDIVLESRLREHYRQSVWGRRGLVIHKDPADQATAALLLGLAPFDPTTWETDPLSWWTQVPHPR